MRLGNDIVDLNATAEHNPRFIDRILHPDEKARNPSWNLSDPLIWQYWAAKEAAYKAIKQTADIPFHHREFIVAPGFDQVLYHDQTLHLRMEGLLALCTDLPLHQCYSAVHEFPAEPPPAVQSAEARALLLGLAALQLGVPQEELAITALGRIPRLLLQDKILPNPVSLTHHGRYVAASLAVLTSIPGI